MRFFLAAAVAGLLLMATQGCSLAQSEPPVPQVALPVSDLTITTARGPVHFTVELANTDEARRRGLMYREQMAADHGMLFDFGRPAYQAFWMKNTILPLDMIFIRDDGTISSIAANTTPYSLAAVRSQEPVRAVLEINAGRAAALGIMPGQQVQNAVFQTNADKSPQ
ncbi:MAG TPA: DUF192 domain-containing protein [Rhizomicrobium sp.]|nr:DUF192 domain-containing protein [Rhizomicrobium sp.]